MLKNDRTVLWCSHHFSTFPKGGSNVHSEVYSKHCQTSKMERFAEIDSQNSLSYRRLTRRGEGGGLSCPFSKIGKKGPNFEKKNALIVVEFHIQNVVFRVSRRKNNFPCGAFLTCAVDGMFIKVP